MVYLLIVYKSVWAPPLKQFFLRVSGLLREGECKSHAFTRRHAACKRGGEEVM